jgi:hypothetical protein
MSKRSAVGAASFVVCKNPILLKLRRSGLCHQVKRSLMSEEYAAPNGTRLLSSMPGLQIFRAYGARISSPSFSLLIPPKIARNQNPFIATEIAADDCSLFHFSG